MMKQNYIPIYPTKYYSELKLKNISKINYGP